MFDPFDRSNGPEPQQTADIRTFFPAMARTKCSVTKTGALPEESKDVRRSGRQKQPSKRLGEPYRPVASGRSALSSVPVDAVLDSDDELYEPTPKRQRSTSGKPVKAAVKAVASAPVKKAAVTAAAKPAAERSAPKTPETSSKAKAELQKDAPKANEPVFTLEECGLLTYEAFLETLGTSSWKPQMTTAAVAGRIILKLNDVLDPRRSYGFTKRELWDLQDIKMKVFAIPQRPEHLAEAQAYVDMLLRDYDLDCRAPEPTTYSRDLPPTVLRSMYEDHKDVCESRRADLMRSYLYSVQYSAL